ncbi:MAG: LysR family transcriptional regulator [Myxococcota bacterium]
MKTPIIDGIELSDLRALVAIADQGTLLGAANAASTSRGTIRRRLARLEDTIGVSLYEQGADGIFLTTAGSVLVEHTRRLVEILRGALEDVFAAAETPVRTIRTLGPNGLPPEVLAQGLTALSHQSPDLMMDISFSPDPLKEDLSQYELIIHFGPPPTRGFLVTRELMSIPEILVASPSYLNLHGKPDELEALADHRLLSWSPPGEPADRWILSNGQSLSVSPTIVSSDIHLIRELAINGQGIARVLEANLPIPGNNELVRLLPQHFQRNVSLRLLIADGLQRTPRMRQAVRVLDMIGIDIGLAQNR